MKIIVICLVLFVISASGNATELGRLFVSESERSIIDSMRKKGLYRERSVSADSDEKRDKGSGFGHKSVEKKPKAPEKNLITINGFIQRADGSSTVWINGHVDKLPLEGNHLRAVVNDQGEVIIKAKNRIKKLKVGQKWNYKTDRIYFFSKTKKEEKPKEHVSKRSGEQ